MNQGSQTGTGSEARVAQSSVRVVTTEFEWAHRRKPRGYGHWAFEIGSERFWQVGSFAEAKRMAIRYAADHGEREVKVLS